MIPNQIPPPMTFPVNIGTLRAQLGGKFQEIQNAIASVIVRDPLTILIEEWLQSFRQNIQRSLNEQIVFDTHILALQRLLRDSYDNAPLDSNAWIGTDDNTYGSLTIAATRAAFPASGHDVSPSTGEEITIRPHPVARLLVNWLVELGASLYSPELVDRYLHEMPEAEAVAEEVDAQNQQISGIMQRHLQRQQEGKQSEEAEWDRLEARLARMQQEHTSDRQQLDARIARLTEPFTQVGAEIAAHEAVVAQNTLNSHTVRQNMQQLLDERITPIEQRINQYVPEHLNRLRVFENQERERLEPIENLITVVRAQNQTIETQNTQLHHNQMQLEQSITQLTAQQQLLKSDLQRLYETISRIERRKKNSLLEAVGFVALSALATWGLSVLNISASLNCRPGLIGIEITL